MRLLRILRRRLDEAGFHITREEAEGASMISSWPDLIDLGSIATQVAYKYCLGQEVVRCSAEYEGTFCDQKCSFCAFGAEAPADVISEQPIFLKSVEEMVAAAKAREAAGATRFKIVTTGRALSAERFARVVESFRRISTETSLYLCASLGFLTRDQIMVLKGVGVRAINNNLETSRRFFPNVCHTHTFDEKIETIHHAKEAGMEVCSGMVVGLGENVGDRVDVAVTLASLGVDSAPFNVFVPTRKEHLDKPRLSPFELLRSLAVFRLQLPNIKIMCNAGRQGFGPLHPYIYAMGANGYALRSYLTPKWDPETDLEIESGLGCAGEKE